MEKKRLRRKCVMCAGVFNVRREGDAWQDRFSSVKVENFIQWQSNPFAAEIHNDYTPMWLCDYCADESAMDI